MTYSEFIEFWNNSTTVPLSLASKGNPFAAREIFDQHTFSFKQYCKNTPEYKDNINDRQIALAIAITDILISIGHSNKDINEKLNVIQDDSTLPFIKDIKSLVLGQSTENGLNKIIQFYISKLDGLGKHIATSTL